MIPAFMIVFWKWETEAVKTVIMEREEKEFLWEELHTDLVATLSGDQHVRG